MSWTRSNSDYCDLQPKATGEGDSKCPKIVLVGDRDSSYDEDLTDSNEDNCEEDDNMNDPDWQRTPLIRRRRVVSHHIKARIAWPYLMDCVQIAEEKVFGAVAEFLQY